MPLLRHLTDDEVLVPQVNRLVRYLFGAVAFFGCALLVMFHGVGPVKFPVMLAMMTSLCATVGVACLSWVSVVRINRKTKTVFRGWGFYFTGAPVAEIVEPTAIRLLIDTNESERRSLDHHIVMVVDAKRQTVIRTTWCLDTARRLADELSEFMDLEVYEDRLATTSGWLKPLMGIGVDPNVKHIVR